MNIKNINLIIPILCVSLKVVAGTINNEVVDVDISFGNESDDEIYSLGEEIELNGDDEIVDIFSDDENIIETEIIDIDEEVCSSEECIQVSKRFLSSMDITVDPCDNFYKYACGGWKDSNKLFNVNDKIREILEGEYTPNEELSKEDQMYDEKTFKKLKNMYNICINKEINESYPNEHLINFVKKFNITENKDSLSNTEALTDLFVKLQTNGVYSFIELFIPTKESISDRPIVGIKFSKNNYEIFSVVEEIPDSLPLFKDYIKSMITIIFGDRTDIDSVVDSILASGIKVVNLISELKLMSHEEDINNNNQIEGDEALKLNELNEKYPFINWNSYIKGIFEFYNLGEFVNDEMIIYNQSAAYLEGIQKLISEMSVGDIANYLEWSTIVLSLSSFTNYISGDIVKANRKLSDDINELFMTLFSGDLNEMNGFDAGELMNTGEDAVPSNIQEQYKEVLRKRNEVKEEEVKEEKVKDDDYEDDYEEGSRFYTCLLYLDNVMPLAISKYFIEKNFRNDIKSKTEDMIKNIKESMINRIPKMEWLDDETKQHAIEKVLKMKDRIAYPDDIMDPKKLYQKYENLEIDNLFDLIIKSNSLSYGIKLRDIDVNEWPLTPHTDNAYYIPNTNSINFAAAILRKQLYDSNEIDYINYGSGGSIIGHELTHAFDNKGKKYDAEGHLNNWWTDNDNEEFKEYSQCFIDEYNSFTYKFMDKEMNVDGEYTLAENLADNGGLARAYDGWQLSILKNPEKSSERNKKLPGLENYTLDQLFYISYSQWYCSYDYFDISDEHSPNSARVNGVVSNSKHFAKTFNCPTNKPMNPENKCLIW